MNRQTQLIKSNPIGLNIPPAAPELEEAVLGALMLERDAMDKINGIIDEDCFYLPINKEIYKAIHQLYSGHLAIDLLTVYERLKGNEIFENNGGIGYLSALTSRIASAIHIEDHARILREKQLKRAVIAACNQLQQSAYDETGDVADVLNDFANTSDKLNGIIATGTDIVSAADAVKTALLSFEERQEKLKNGTISGIPTGLNKLDRVLGRLQAGQMIVIAARAAMGKTAFALNLLYTSASSGFASSFLSLEMDEKELTNRLFLRECSQIRPDILKNTLAIDNEIKEINIAAGRIERLPITFIKNTSVTINSLKSRCRTLKKRKGLDLLIIDYLQLMNGEKATNREQEVAKISRELKKMAMELNIPVVVLSQLSREVEKREVKKPQLSDLRESGAIEQDADLVLLLNRPEYYGIAEIDDGKGKKISSHRVGIVYVAKNRNGNTGHVLFRHNDTMTKISDYE